MTISENIFTFTVDYQPNKHSNEEYFSNAEVHIPKSHSPNTNLLLCKTSCFVYNNDLNENRKNYHQIKNLEMYRRHSKKRVTKD